jgi:KipI family sensor histidine kinase inhibitor
MYRPARYLPVGDRAVLVEFGNAISLDINRHVHALDRAIAQQRLPGVEECVPTYRSLLVYYDPATLSYERLVFSLKDLEARLGEFHGPTPGQQVEVPVAYGGDYGPDLEYVARYHHLSQAEAIRLHSGRTYHVYMIGFLAGFPYLGEVTEEIATPRLSTPRLRVPAGSVGIADTQTGIYPCDAPGGWQIIGRTPSQFFSLENRPPALIRPGDTVKFRPVSRREFQHLRKCHQ